jgi:superfamily II DNA or RNA helicase
MFVDTGAGKTGIFAGLICRRRRSIRQGDREAA